MTDSLAPADGDVVGEAEDIILWPDRDRQWQAAIPQLQAAMPELYAPGAYDPDARSGPAIWMHEACC